MKEGGEEGRESKEEGRKGEKREGGRRRRNWEIPTVYTCTYTVLHVIHVLMCTH